MTRMPLLLLFVALGCGPTQSRVAEPVAPPIAASTSPAEAPTPPPASTDEVSPPQRVAPPPPSLSPPSTARCAAGTKDTLSVALVLDTSGSMAGPPIDALRDAAIAAVATLDPTDQLYIVSFDSRPHEMLALAPVGDGRAARDALTKLDAVGGTDGSPALELALTALSKSSSQRRHVLFLADGQMPPAGIEDIVSALHACGATVSTIGLGHSVDASLLSKMAEMGGGRFIPLSKPSELAPAFHIQLRSP